MRSHKIVSVQKTVELVDRAPRWCFCVEYLEGVRSSGRSKRIDYKEVLSEKDFAVFARLRDARKALGEAEAVPVYAVCTNEQLAAMATRRPKSLSALKEIDGL
ncbi:HRDC domain-containing protein, partial [bacterium]|nr:HRDC domain-containing protein [bacterium]